jgi:NO-binding membrane sensor protein with MHYT domain
VCSLSIGFGALTFPVKLTQGFGYCIAAAIVLMALCFLSLTFIFHYRPSKERTAIASILIGVLPSIHFIISWKGIEMTYDPSISHAEGALSYSTLLLIISLVAAAICFILMGTCTLLTSFLSSTDVLL